MTIDPAAFAPPAPTFAEQIKHNAEVAAKSGSTYVVLVAGVLGALYASMSAAQQMQLVEAWPILRGWTPVVTVLITFIVAKLKPSDTVSAQTKALIDEVARLRLNVFLRAHGAQELPPPPTTPIPVVPTVVPVPVRVPVPMPQPTPAPAPQPEVAKNPWPYPPGIVEGAGAPPKWADTEANAVAPVPPAPPVPPVPPPMPARSTWAIDPTNPPSDRPAPAPTPVTRSPDEPVTRVDVALPIYPPPPPAPKLPIDPRLLMALIQEYLSAQAPGKPPPPQDASSHL